MKVSSLTLAILTLLVLDLLVCVTPTAPDLVNGRNTELETLTVSHLSVLSNKKSTLTVQSKLVSTFMKISCNTLVVFINGTVLDKDLVDMLSKL